MDSLAFPLVRPTSNILQLTTLEVLRSSRTVASVSKLLHRHGACDYVSHGPVLRLLAERLGVVGAAGRRAGGAEASLVLPGLRLLLGFTGAINQYPDNYRAERSALLAACVKQGLVDAEGSISDTPVGVANARPLRSFASLELSPLDTGVLWRALSSMGDDALVDEVIDALSLRERLRHLRPRELRDVLFEVIMFSPYRRRLLRDVIGVDAAIDYAVRSVQQVGNDDNFARDRAVVVLVSLLSESGRWSSVDIRFVDRGCGSPRAESRSGDGDASPSVAEAAPRPTHTVSCHTPTSARVTELRQLFLLMARVTHRSTPAHVREALAPALSNDLWESLGAENRIHSIWAGLSAIHQSMKAVASDVTDGAGAGICNDAPQRLTAFIDGALSHHLGQDGPPLTFEALICVWAVAVCFQCSASLIQQLSEAVQRDTLLLVTLHDTAGRCPNIGDTRSGGSSVEPTAAQPLPQVATSRISPLVASTIAAVLSRQTMQHPALAWPMRTQDLVIGTPLKTGPRQAVPHDAPLHTNGCSRCVTLLATEAPAVVEQLGLVDAVRGAMQLDGYMKVQLEQLYESPLIEGQSDVRQMLRERIAAAPPRASALRSGRLKIHFQL